MYTVVTENDEVKFTVFECNSEITNLSINVKASSVFA